MAFELETITEPAVKETSLKYGTARFSMAAGKSLKVETSPQGEDILDVTVPQGKLWEVSVDITIREVSV